MKKLHIIILAITAIFVGCTSEEEKVTPTVDEVKQGVWAADFEDADGLFTRSEVYMSNGSVSFRWKDGDVLGVYPYKEGVTDTDIRLSNFTLYNSTGNDARFRGKGFSLDPEYDYYSFSDYDVANGSTGLNQAIDYRDIKMTYEGQRMPSNGSLEHLGKFDYQAARAINVENNSAFFYYKHLGAVVRFVFQQLPEGVKFNKMSISTTDNSDLKYLRHVNLLAGGEKGSAYNPKLFVDSDDKVVTSFDVALGPEDGTGIAPANDNTLSVFMMMPNTTDFKDKTWYVKLIPVDQNEDTYYMYLPARDEFIGGKAYSYTRVAAKAGELRVQIRVDKDWKLGRTTNQTRADKGDPGVDGKIIAPTSVSIYTCVNEVVKDIQTFNDLQENTDWLGTSSVLTLNRNVSVRITESDPNTKISVYAFANTENVTLSNTPQTESPATTVATIQGMTYTSGDQNALKNLYSAPYTGDGYVGDVRFDNTKPMIADLTLYHVAAKVDVQWSFSTAISTDSYVSINNVKNSDVYLFKPTENTWESGSYTVSEQITPGTMWNGRQVFYLPQFANPNSKYNITVGTTTDVTFTPSVENGWTSWLKANITSK